VNAPLRPPEIESPRKGDVVRRLGQVIHVRPDAIDAYERLHANPWPTVNAAIHRANIRNYSIYRFHDLLFAYFEHVGDDFRADMARMAADPEVQRWWALTDAMQEPFPERPAGDWWLTLTEIFHTD
jgi:L-rhamnose mutarotase